MEKINIQFTLNECLSLVEHIDLTIFPTIREDPEIDGVEWLASIMSAYTKLKKGIEELK